MAQGFLARVAGKTKQILATVASAGAADAGKIIALDGSGRLDNSVMPAGIGANTVAATASEALAAGTFVNLFNNAGVFAARLADNSNGRQADGYVLTAVALSGVATVYALDGVNSAQTALTIGSAYWLGTAGGVTATPLDETLVANANKVSQYLGVAKSATELVTDDHGYVVL